MKVFCFANMTRLLITNTCLFFTAHWQSDKVSLNFTAQQSLQQALHQSYIRMPPRWYPINKVIHSAHRYISAILSTHSNLKPSNAFSIQSFVSQTNNILSQNGLFTPSTPVKPPLLPKFPQTSPLILSAIFQKNLLVMDSPAVVFLSYRHRPWQQPKPSFNP